ncbi:MBL fold metallo-hydrolase [Emcibacter sp.]|uniref:MBL fold metallo-hydrolase n=1 Tax=Emcibacter sp. TaxID=1979954 RepID=UPI002AA8B619|nr:MBL fold metallo-hydrolase [Emcibacter sp.]
MTRPNRPQMQYPFSDDLEYASPEMVAEGVYRCRIPLEFGPPYINSWLLEEEDGWTVVDTGMGTEVSSNAWRKVFKNFLGDKPVNRLIATHMHPDHLGLAGWICHKWNIPLHMSQTEYLMARTLIADTHHDVPDEATTFIHAAGYTGEQEDMYRAEFGKFGSVIRTLPHAFHRLKDGDRLTIGGVDWNVVIGRGHSPEHVCLHCPEKNLFIAGDQLLPEISSNISVWPTEPEANPLKDWLESCAKLKDYLPEDVLVLPAHGNPFRGARERLAYLIADHEENLAKLLELCQTPVRVPDCFVTLFKRELPDDKINLATGETIAHLNYLIHDGSIIRETDDKGVNHYRRAE